MLVDKESLEEYGFSENLVKFIHKKTGLSEEDIVMVLKAEREYYLYLLSQE